MSRGTIRASNQFAAGGAPEEMPERAKWQKTYDFLPTTVSHTNLSRIRASLASYVLCSFINEFLEIVGISKYADILFLCAKPHSS